MVKYILILGITLALPATISEKPSILDFIRFQPLDLSGYAYKVSKSEVKHIVRQIISLSDDGVRNYFINYPCDDNSLSTNSDSAKFYCKADRVELIDFNGDKVPELLYFGLDTRNGVEKNYLLSKAEGKYVGCSRIEGSFLTDIKKKNGKIIQFSTFKNSCCNKPAIISVYQVADSSVGIRVMQISSVAVLHEGDYPKEITGYKKVQVLTDSLIIGLGGLTVGKGAVGYKTLTKKNESEFDWIYFDRGEVLPGKISLAPSWSGVVCMIRKSNSFLSQ